MKTELTQSSVSYRCGRMIAIVWLCVVPSIVQAQSKDIIWQRESGEMVSGEILSVDPEIIRIRAKGGIQDIGTEDISKVRFGDDPSGMSGVRSSVDSGQLEQAQKQIRQVKPGGRDFVRQDAAFYRVLIDSRLALNGQGSINAAAKAVNDFLSSNPDSFRYYDASIVMGDLAMTLGRYDVAAKLYGRLTAAKSANRQAEGNLHQGYALLHTTLWEPRSLPARMTPPHSMRSCIRICCFIENTNNTPKPSIILVRSGRRHKSPPRRPAHGGF